MRLYRLLLHLYPASFRAEYGEELCAFFAAHRRDATTLPARLHLWFTVIADVVTSAMQTHGDLTRQDLRYALRVLARSPGFTATAILVAAIGIGANTAVFSITDHVLIRPLPYADSSRLVRLWENREARGYRRLEPSPANYRDWKRLATNTFENIAAFQGFGATLTGGAAPERLPPGARVTGDLFQLLGTRAELGRLFTVDDEREGTTIVLSHRLWRMRFGADPTIVGKVLTTDAGKITVIGVAPADFFFPSRDVEYWVPLTLSEREYEARDDHYLSAIGRLRPGVSLAQARAEMLTLGEQLERLYPKDNRGATIGVSGLRDELPAGSRLLLLALVGASLGVLLIACANLANLLLARALVRRKEMALRAVLGAGRERLVRQLITENALLAGAGGLLGILLAWLGLPLLVRLVPNSLPIADAPSLDLRVLTLAAGLTLITGLGFGVIPAIRACRASAAVLQEGSRAGVGGRRERIRAALVVAAVAASVALSIASGLLVRALWQLRSIDPGFRTDHAIAMTTPLNMSMYQKTARREQVYDRVLADVRGLPGVSAAGYASHLPMAFKGGVFPVVPEGEPPEDSKRRQASVRFISAGYIPAMGIMLTRGRDLLDSDGPSSPRVALVSESFARQFWPDRDAIGRRFSIAEQDRTVVGIVGDVRVRGLEMASEPQVYLPSRQMPDAYFMFYMPRQLVIRTSLEAASLAPAVRQIVARAAPNLPITDVRTLEDLIDQETGPRTTQVRVLGVFAAVAFVLAGIGIHGLLSFAVSHRAQEIGVRMAMGAQVRDILRLILGESLLLATIGIAGGGLLAYGAARAMEALLAGVSPRDPLTFLIGMGVAFVMTLAGSAMPALRAVRVDPMTVIRSD